MNDLEQRIKDILEADATKAPTVQRAPGELRSKVRKRQVGTALVGLMAAVAVLAVSFAGFRVLDRADLGPTPADPWAGYEVFERTATIGNFTITSPSDWYLVDQWDWAGVERARLRVERERAQERCAELARDEKRPCLRALALGYPGDTAVTPILMMSNNDLGLDRSPCFDEGFALGPEDTVMTIAFETIRSAAAFGVPDGTPRWPVAFDSTADDDWHSCGPGTYVSFAAGDFPYVAHFAFGEEVSEQDRETLIASFEGMQVADSTAPFLTASDRGSAYVLTGGEAASGPWSLELRPAGDDPSANAVDLQIVSLTGAGASLNDSTVSPRHPIEQAGGDPVFGTVTKGAEGVELRSGGGATVLPGSVMPIPPSIRSVLDVYVVENPDGVRGTVVPLGVNLPSPASATSDPRRVLEGFDLGVPWALNHEPDGDLRCALFQVGDVGELGIFESCADGKTLRGEPQLEAFRVPDAGGTFIWGLVSPDVASVRVRWIAPGVSGDTIVTPTPVGSSKAPAGVFVVPVPASDGMIQVGSFDENGTKLRRATPFPLTDPGNLDGMDTAFQSKSRLVAGRRTYLWLIQHGDEVCYRAFGFVGSVESCAVDGAVQSYVISPTDGQIALVLQPAGEFTNGLKLVTDDGSTISTRLCTGIACVIAVPTGSGSGATYTIQRAEPWTAAARLSWVPEAVGFG